MENSSDKDLTVLIKQSDLNALQVLYKRYFEAIYRFLCQRCDEDLAKDLTQDIFLRLWETREKLNPEKPVKSFLYRLAVNISIDHFRKQKRNVIPLSPQNEHSLTTENDDDLVITIQNTIAELPEDLRITFNLNRFEGFKYREIADLLGISVKTVESRMSKALKILCEKLGNILLSIFF